MRLENTEVNSIRPADRTLQRTVEAIHAGTGTGQTGQRDRHAPMDNAVSHPGMVDNAVCGTGFILRGSDLDLIIEILDENIGFGTDRTDTFRGSDRNPCFQDAGFLFPEERSDGGLDDIPSKGILRPGRGKTWSPRFQYTCRFISEKSMNRFQVFTGRRGYARGRAKFENATTGLTEGGKDEFKCTGHRFLLNK